MIVWLVFSSCIAFSYKAYTLHNRAGTLASLNIKVFAEANELYIFNLIFILDLRLWIKLVMEYKLSKL